MKDSVLLVTTSAWHIDSFFGHIIHTSGLVQRSTPQYIKV